MLNILNFFKKKKIEDGFHASELFVQEIKMPIEDGISWIYTCSFLEFFIRFEYKDTNQSINEFGIITVSYKETLIYKKTPNLALTGVPLSIYVKKLFTHLIIDLKKIDTKHIDVMFPFLNTDAFKYTQSLEFKLLTTYPTGYLYDIYLTQESIAKINTVIRGSYSWNNFQIVYYDNKIFSYLYNQDNYYYVYKNIINLVIAISINIQQIFIREGYTLHTYERRSNEVFFDIESKSVLLYNVIKHKNHYFKHAKNKEYSNNITIHIFWVVNVEDESTKLTIFIYDKDILIEEYKHSMETKFFKHTIDLKYYENFLHSTIEKLLLYYYPSEKLIKLLEIDVNYNFEGKLTEEQYLLFKMISI